MNRDATTRKALQVLRKARGALPAGPRGTPSSSSPSPSSSLPKPVYIPVTSLVGHSKPTLPSINRLLGRPIQIPPPKKKGKWKDLGGKPKAKERFGSPYVGLPIVQLNHGKASLAPRGKGKQAARDGEALTDSIKAHIASGREGGSGPSLEAEKENAGNGTGETLEGIGSKSAASGLSTGWVKEDWFSEPWDKGKSDASSSSRSAERTEPGQESQPQSQKKKRKGVPPHIRVTLSKRDVQGLLQPTEDSILEDVVQDTPQPPVAALAHGLDRVLFNPGVHWVQDPRSRVYNFTPWIQSVPAVDDFDFNRIPQFVPSSRDDALFTLAKKQGRRFAGSTSSLTGILGQCYFLISGEKEVDTSVLSEAFRNKAKTFTPAQRWPSSVKLNYREGVYTVDSAKSEMDLPEKNILLWLGTILEKFLTVPAADFTKLLQSTPIPEATLAELQNDREAYRYAQSHDFVMRSQLDCHDRRLPGTGVFDIKTRACAPTRLDVLNYEEHTGYTIKKLHGQLESFEKEYYDLIRSAFLKYSFQVRIGNMDGVIVAYHNTQTLFGLQYIPLSEMDERLFGPGEGIGDKVFDKCVGLMEKVVDEVVSCFGRQSCNATFFTKEDTEAMYVWVEPSEWDGDEEQKPVEQLRVEVKSYLGEDPVLGHRAVSHCWKPDSPWTMEYKIQRLDVDPAKAKRDLALAKEKMFKAHIVPSGVDAEGLEEYWQTLSHGNATEQHSIGVGFDPAQFQTVVPPFIQMLRDVSRKGREEREELEAKYKNEPKVVLGETSAR